MKNDLHQTVLLCRKEIMGTSMVYSKCSLFEEDGYNIVSCTSHNTITDTAHTKHQNTQKAFLDKFSDTFGLLLAVKNDTL